MPVRCQLKNKCTGYYFTLIRVSFHIVLRLYFVLNVISRSCLGFYGYTTFYLYSLTRRILLQTRTTFNLFLHLEANLCERKNALTKIYLLSQTICIVTTQKSFVLQLLSFVYLQLAIVNTAK